MAGVDVTVSSEGPPTPGIWGAGCEPGMINRGGPEIGTSEEHGE